MASAAYHLDVQLDLEDAADHADTDPYGLIPVDGEVLAAKLGDRVERRARAAPGVRADAEVGRVEHDLPGHAPGATSGMAARPAESTVVRPTWRPTVSVRVSTACSAGQPPGATTRTVTEG